MIRARIAVAATICLLAAAPARAYVRYRTEAGAPLAWSGTCLAITAYPAALAEMMPPDRVSAAASAAAQAWSADQVAGTALEILVTTSDGAAPAAANDGRSALIFRTDSWCKAGEAPGSCSYDPAALALTSVFARTSTGEILDADIEVNAKLFLWADLDLGTQASANVQDLQNALTHEVGHLIGLDHPCLLPGSNGPPSVDDLGNPVPACDDAPEAILESTMFPSATPGDLSKRTLAPDDELAAREIYPANVDGLCTSPTPATEPPSWGCAASGALPPAPGALACVAAAFAWAAARRRPRARSGRRDREAGLGQH